MVLWGGFGNDGLWIMRCEDGKYLVIEFDSYTRFENESLKAFEDILKFKFGFPYSNFRFMLLHFYALKRLMTCFSNHFIASQSATPKALF